MVTINEILINDKLVMWESLIDLSAVSVYELYRELEISSVGFQKPKYDIMSPNAISGFILIGRKLQEDVEIVFANHKNSQTIMIMNFIMDYLKS